MNGSGLLKAGSEANSAEVLPLTDVRTAPTQRDVAAFLKQHRLNLPSYKASHLAHHSCTSSSSSISRCSLCLADAHTGW
jgi:hypothetical protein